MNAINRSFRPYQAGLLTDSRKEAGKGFKSIMIQLVTGGGKTRMVAGAIKRAISKKIPGTDKNQNVWFIVPRKELLWQASKEFHEWKIKHGMISAKSKESAAFQVHIASKDALIRRIKQKKIRTWPNIIFIDEAHLALDQQLFIKKSAPPCTIFLGWTATPEKLDGRGLNEMYETIVYGPDLMWMVEHDYLKRPWILSIPKEDRIGGLSEAEYTKSGDLKKSFSEKLNEAYKQRAIDGISYGNEIEHYRKFGLGRSFLVFCRSIPQAEQVAEEFQKSGFRVESIDGGMTDRVRQEKIKRVENGELDGLTTVDLVTYGLDVPKISCIIMLRPTASVALFFQMIGRGLRPDKDFENCLILDHVGNCDEKNHGHPLAPRVWNFGGNIKKKKIPKDAIEKLENVQKCPVCWDIMVDGICRSCGQEQEIKTRKPLKQVDGWLVEITEPTPMQERPPENRRHYQDMISNNKDRFKDAWYGDGKENKGGVINKESVKNLMDAGHDLKWPNYPMKIFYMLTNGDLTVNVSLLSEIAEIKGYHHIWLTRKREELEEKFNRRVQNQERQDEARESYFVN